MKSAILILTHIGLLTRLEAGQALVSTRDGQRWAGPARLESNAVVVASLEQSHIARIPLSNLMALRFVSEPEPLFEPKFGPAPSNPGRWEQTDVGFGLLPGQSRAEGGPVWMTTGGTNIAGSADAFRFVYLPMKGDGEIVAHLSQLTAAVPEARAGLMLRESTEAGTRNVFLGLTRRGGVFHWRAEPGQATQGRDSRFANRWLRLKREGDQFLGYVSRNGRQWELIERTRVNMTEDILAGLALTGCADPVSAPVRPPGWNWSHCRFDSVQAGSALRFHSFSPRIVLTSGSIISGEIPSATDGQVFYAGPTGLESVKSGQIARIDFYWVPSWRETQLRQSQPGTLLASGEFIEGQLRRMGGGKCTLSSILFGLRQFDVNSEVVSIVMGQPLRRAAPEPFRLRTWSGSVWRAAALRLEPSGLLFQDRTLGQVRVAYHELKELERMTAD